MGSRLPERGIHLGQIPEPNNERSDGVADPTTTLLHCISITVLDVVLDIELVVESGGPPVQRGNETLAGTGSKGQS